MRLPKMEAPESATAATFAAGCVRSIPDSGEIIPRSSIATENGFPAMATAFSACSRLLAVQHRASLSHRQPACLNDSLYG